VPELRNKYLIMNRPATQPLSEQITVLVEALGGLGAAIFILAAPRPWAAEIAALGGGRRIRKSISLSRMAAFA
jgi:hypothetical protein